MSRLSDQEKIAEKLRREHSKLDAQLKDLEGRRWLSSEDEAEVRRLKRLKLAKKDLLRQIHPEA